MVSFLIYDFMAITLFVLNREESSLFNTSTNNFQDPGVIETGQVTSAKYAYPFFNLLVKKQKSYSMETHTKVHKEPLSSL